MKLTNKSKTLMSFFAEHSCMLPVKQTIKTENILKHIYSDLSGGVTYIQSLKSKLGKSFYKIKMVDINNINQIPKPITFNSNAFPPEILKHIDNYSLNLITYFFQAEKINFLQLISRDHI